MKKTVVFACMLPMLLLAFACNKEISNDAPQRDVQVRKSGNATIWVQNVQLSGLNEVPSNDLGATGVAILRLTADKVLHSKVLVEVPEGAGTLTASHIHLGAAGTNGPVQIFLCHSAADFGVNQEAALTDAQYNLLLDESMHLYVNAHSTVKPGGLVRGQIR